MKNNFNNSFDLIKGRKAQVAIFIIVAIVLVVGVVVFFLVRNNFSVSLPKDMEPVYDYYLSCIEQTTEEGINLLGEQGGYIYVDDLEFVTGSRYRPFSSQLDFLGQPVPYWMYVSGNNLLKEQVPSENGMEQELESYISERIGECDFSDFERQGYLIYFEDDDVSVDVEINDLNVDVSVDNEFSIFYGEESANVGRHRLDVDSKLGKFYDLALDTYNYEKENMFLEEYALDVMRLYAPVDGVELTCEPKIFVDEEIEEDLKEGLSVNVFALKLKGDYYDLSSQESDYFVSDIGRDIDENVNFVYMPDWPTRVEIYGERVVRPVGLQEGLGILGFCYVPYHLVYDINFPVLVQFYDSSGFIFQFPIGVIIDKNQAREALPSSSGINIESEVCRYQNQEIEVYTYDTDLNPVEARVQFKCLNDVCELGESELLSGGDAVFRGNAPQCVNGFVITSADGYSDGRYQISTNEESVANVIMNKIYNVSLDLGNVDRALVTFNSEDYSTTALYPDFEYVELVEGYYNVTVYVYRNSSLVIPSTSKTECVEIPEEGIAGLFGAEKEKCYSIEIPAVDVEMAVVGGGKQQEYITRDQLRNSRELNINVPLFGTPSSLEELQENYLAVDGEKLELVFE